MKLLIDTNIFIEYFEKRQHFESVRMLFNALEDGIHTGYISTGSFYTLAYIVDQGFKRKGYNKPERLDFVRSVLLGVLDLVNFMTHPLFYSPYTPTNHSLNRSQNSTISSRVPLLQVPIKRRQ